MTNLAIIIWEIISAFCVALAVTGFIVLVVVQ